MLIKFYNKEKKDNTIFYKQVLSIFLIMIFFIIFSGCARWPEGGGGNEKKLLVIRVDINETGLINTDSGRYYITFDARKEAAQPPAKDTADWNDGYHYIKLDNMGFCFGKWGKSCQYTSIGMVGDKYFQVTLDIDSFDNPERIFMNVIATDNDDNTYDSVGNPIDLTINTNIPNFNTLVQDFPGDSSGGPDFDIIKVNISLLTK